MINPWATFATMAEAFIILGCAREYDRPSCQDRCPNNRAVIRPNIALSSTDIAFISIDKSEIDEYANDRCDNRYH